MRSTLRIFGAHPSSVFGLLSTRTSFAVVDTAPMISRRDRGVNFDETEVDLVGSNPAVTNLAPDR